MRRSSGLAKAGLFCGILSIPLSFLAWALTILLSLIGIIFAAVGLLLALVRPRRYTGKGLALSGLLLSTVVLIGSASYVRFHLHKAREAAWKVATMANLLEVNRALWQYAEAHGGQYPPDLRALVSEGYCKPDALLDRFSGHRPPACDFLYIPGFSLKDIESATSVTPGLLGRKVTQEPPWIIAYSNTSFHDGKGAFILYSDGNGTFLQEPEFSAALQQFRDRFQKKFGRPPALVNPG